MKKQDEKIYGTSSLIFFILAVFIGFSGEWGIAMIFFFLSWILIKIKREFKIGIALVGSLFFSYVAFIGNVVYQVRATALIGLVIAIIFLIINIIKYFKEKKIL